MYLTVFLNSESEDKLMLSNLVIWIQKQLNPSDMGVGASDHSLSVVYRTVGKFRGGYIFADFVGQWAAQKLEPSNFIVLHIMRICVSRVTTKLTTLEN